MLTLSNKHVHKRIVVAHLIVETGFTVLGSPLTPTKVYHLAILGISLVLLDLFSLELAFNEVHLEASAGDLVLPHGGVLHPDPH